MLLWKLPKASRQGVYQQYSAPSENVSPPILDCFEEDPPQARHHTTVCYNAHHTTYAHCQIGPDLALEYDISVEISQINKQQLLFCSEQMKILKDYNQSDNEGKLWNIIYCIYVDANDYFNAGEDCSKIGPKDYQNRIILT